MAISKENIEKTKQAILAAEERLKKMTPEERKQYEEAMEKQILIPD